MRVLENSNDGPSREKLEPTSQVDGSGVSSARAILHASYCFNYRRGLTNAQGLSLQTSVPVLTLLTLTGLCRPSAGASPPAAARRRPLLTLALVHT